jgi:hypothetical protein
MIDVMALRCGNWITTEGFLKPVQVTAHSIIKIKERPEKSYPIAITPKIIEQAGFELRTSNVSKLKYWQNESIVWHENGDVYLWTETKAQINISVKYVHQLQNFYLFICGRELQLSLNSEISPEELYGLQNLKKQLSIL